MSLSTDYSTILLLSIVIYVGIFHQFDGIMYPEGSVKTGTWNPFRGWFGGGLSIPEHDVVQQKSLPVYLRFHKDILLTCNVTNISIFSYIFHIFYQLHSPKVHYNNCSHIWPGHGVSQVCTFKIDLYQLEVVFAIYSCICRP